VTLDAVQIQPATDTAHGRVFARVRVRSEATGDVAGITRFLLALDRGPLRLTVSDVTISQSDPTAATNRPETLHAEFTVDGIALAADTSRRSAARP
jgi:hypothetical protein